MRNIETKLAKASSVFSKAMKQYEEVVQMCNSAILQAENAIKQHTETKNNAGVLREKANTVIEKLNDFLV